MARSPYLVFYDTGLVYKKYGLRSGYRRTFSNGKPNAEPKMIPRRQSQPTVRRILRGRRYHGSWTRGVHTLETGSEMTEVGMNRKAMTLKKSVSDPAHKEISRLAGLTG